MSALGKTLSLTDLTLFGVSSIIGSGGFNLIGKATQDGGRWWPAAFGIAAALLMGGAYSYKDAFHASPRNTAESDLIREELGPIAAWLSTGSILTFNLVSMSTILVLVSQLLFPGGKWLGQIAFALGLLTIMAVFALQGLDFSKSFINGVSVLLLVVLGAAALLGGWGGLTQKWPISGGGGGGNGDSGFVTSLLLFFFVLAGFDALIKFTAEAKDKDDIPRSFFLANGISDILVFGAAVALAIFVPKLTRVEENNALGHLFEHFLGSGVAGGFKLLMTLFMVVTTFVVFLASSRYLVGLGETTPALGKLAAVTEKKVPYGAIGAVFAVTAAAVTLNRTDTLVKISDVGLIVTILLVSVSAALNNWRSDRKGVAAVHGATAAGFTTLLGAALF